MDFVTKRELDAIREEAKRSFGAIAAIKDREARIKEAIEVAMLFDYYIVSSAGGEAIIEGVSAMRDGSFVASRSTFREDAPEQHHVAQGNLLIDTSHFASGALAQVKEMYGRGIIEKAAA